MQTPADHPTANDPISALEKLAAQDPSFVPLLTESLKRARSLAEGQLDRDLFYALLWPSDFASYLNYLQEFGRWAPIQSESNAWNKPGTKEHQEVYDRLCHFYFLIDQPVGPGGTVIVQNINWFSSWLVSFADWWGSFLNSTDSFSEAQLLSFMEGSPEYDVQSSMVNGRPNAPSGWLTFNQFFARELNPGLRLISNPNDNRVVTCPADCTYRAQYAIGPDSSIPEITIKGTHKFANVEDLLAGSAYRSRFAGGTFVHYFLGPYSYHRFHSPVAGVVKECYPIQGKVYLQVNLANGQFNAPDSAQGGYEFSQARGVLIVDTTGHSFGDIGLVAVVPVGMCQVSSVTMTATVGRSTLKGDEFGYFLFGGSDIIVLFEQRAHPKVGTQTNYRHYGTPIAFCSVT